MASRPHFWSLLRPQRQWRYRVIISRESTEIFEPLLLKNLPFNAQVGIIGHELSHILYYQGLNFWQMLKFSALYAVDANFRRKHERSTDKQTVYQGLGWQLYDYAHFIRHNIPATSPYMNSEHKVYMDRNYLSDKEILTEMKKLNVYDLSKK